MRIAKLVGSLTLAAAFFGVAGVAAHAESDWQKSYPLNGHPSLWLSSSDSSLEVRSCGSCASVQVRVVWNDSKPGDYSIAESQSGNHVNFVLKEKPGFKAHFGFGSHRGPQVFVDTPQKTDVEMHTSDGSMSVADIQGVFVLQASDGSIRMHNITGTLAAHTSDGSAKIDGNFSAIELHSSDGSMDLTLNSGSRLSKASHISSSDGAIRLQLPANLKADLDLAASDGSIDCKLPLSSNGDASKHHIRGQLNGGGALLEIRSSDGSIHVGQS